MITKINNIGKIVTWNNHRNKVDIINSSNLEIIVKNDYILEIGQNLNNYDIDNIIDARKGLITPGFIDCHTHPVFNDSRAETLITVKAFGFTKGKCFSLGTRR